MEKKFEGRGIQGKDLLAQVKDGVASIYKSNAWKEALVYNARFWNYSFGNQLLIIMQKPDASRVAGFHTWKAQGRSVKKGEKGLAILRPVFAKGSGTVKVDVKDVANAGQVVGEVSKPGQGRGKVGGFTVTYVFDVSQTEGKEVPTYIHKLKGAAPAGLLEGLEGLAASLGIEVQREALKEGMGGYVKKLKEGAHVARIVLNATDPEAEQAASFIHELTHFLCGHLEESRLNDDRQGHELEAESGAFIVGQVLGFDTSACSFGYLANWAASMEAEAREKALEKAGTKAAKAAKVILEGLDKAAAAKLAA